MKKFLFVAVMSMTSMFIKAQHVEFGIKAGVNISNVNQDNADFKTKVGVLGGVLAHIHLNKTWAIQPELVYSQEGAKYDVLNADYKRRLDYLNVPVLLQYLTRSGFRLQTGPQIGFLAGAKDEVNNGNTINIKDNVSSVNFSWTVGAGFLTPVGLGFDARFNAGLGNINEIKNAPKAHSNVVQLGIFYQFGHR